MLEEWMKFYDNYKEKQAELDKILDIERLQYKEL